MTYKPPAKEAKGDLPFAIKGAVFKPEAAGGTIRFDPKARRVQSAQERFFVRGEVTAEILGEAVTVQIEEQQGLTLRLTDQDPWKQ